MSLKWAQPTRYAHRLQLASPFTPSSRRELTTSSSPALPHSSYPLQQHEQQNPPPASDPSQSAETARPYDEIPKTKTTLGLNLDMLRDLSNASNYMKKTARELGHIFKLVGAPGLPPMVCVVDPKDVETVFRVGDAGYPERFLIEVWRDARKEINAPIGMFMS